MHDAVFKEFPSYGKELNSLRTLSYNEISVWLSLDELESSSQRHIFILRVVDFPNLNVLFLDFLGQKEGVVFISMLEKHMSFFFRLPVQYEVSHFHPVILARLFGWQLNVQQVIHIWFTLVAGTVLFQSCNFQDMTLYDVSFWKMLVQIRHSWFVVFVVKISVVFSDDTGEVVVEDFYDYELFMNFLHFARHYWVSVERLRSFLTKFVEQIFICHFLVSTPFVFEWVRQFVHNEIQ